MQTVYLDGGSPVVGSDDDDDRARAGSHRPIQVTKRFPSSRHARRAATDRHGQEEKSSPPHGGKRNKRNKKRKRGKKKTTAAVSRSAASYRPPRTTKHAGLSQARATSSATPGTARTDGFAFLGSPPRREEAHSRGSHSRSRKMRKRWRVGSLSRWIEKRSCRRSSSGSVSYVPAVSRGVASGTASTRHADDAAKR